MATSLPLGIVSLKAEGAYSADKLYKKGMWVTSSGSSYAYINPTPAAGVPVTDTTHWQQIAEKGDKGYTGDSGVYVGADEPENQEKEIWVNPEDGADQIDLDWQTLQQAKNAAALSASTATAQAALAEGYAAQLAAGIASPAGTYADLDALIADDPDYSKIYITLDDGKWCYWNGVAWVAGGVYQAASVVGDIASINSQLADNVQKMNLQNDRFLQVADPYTLEDVAFTTETAKCILADGSITSVISGDINFTVSSDIDVTGGDMFMISAGAGWNKLYYAILDENGVILTGVTSPSDRFDNLSGIVINIPYGAATLRVANVYAPIVVKKVTRSSAKLAKIGYIPSVTYPASVSSIALTDEPNYLLNTAGKKVAFASTNYIVATINVNYGDVYCISARANYGNALYAFYCSDGQVVLKENAVGSDATYTTITKKIVVAPFGAATLSIAYSPWYGEIAKVTSFRSHPIWDGLKWACVGDSLTEINSRALRRYYDYIAYKTGITVHNMGVSGSGYKKLEETGKAFYQRILDVPTDVDVVTIFGSVNDLSQPLGNVTDTETTTLCGCINTTIDNLFSVLPTVPLGIVTPTPCGAMTPGNSMELYANALVDICKRRGIKCLDLYHESGLRPWDATYKSLMYARDDGNGCHPDENGHALIAPKFDALLRSLLLG